MKFSREHYVYFTGGIISVALALLVRSLLKSDFVGAAIVAILIIMEVRYLGSVEAVNDDDDRDDE